MQSINSFDCTNVYEKLDKINEEILKFEEELKTLHDQANIFEQQIMEFKQIKLARRELRLLKNLWDYVNIVASSLDEWKTTFWRKIDVEGMEQECKKLIRELRRKFCINNWCIQSYRIFRSLQNQKMSITSSQYLNI